MRGRYVDKRGVWTAVGLLAFAAFYLYNTFGYSARGASGLPNARTMPLLMVGVLVLLSLVLLWQSLARQQGAVVRHIDPDEDDARLIESPSLRRLGVFLVMLLAYLLVMPVAGFLLSTALFGLALQVVIFRASWIVSAGVSVLVAGASWWLFNDLLAIPLP